MFHQKQLNTAHGQGTFLDERVLCHHKISVCGKMKIKMVPKVGNTIRG